MPYGGGGGYGYSRPAGSSDWAIKSQQMAFGQREQANQYELAQGQSIGGTIAGAPKAFLEAQDMVQQMNIRAQTARANLMQEELRRRRLQQDIDMTDRLYQSDAIQLDVESRREQVRAMKLQNDLAMDKYNEEKQARAKGQELSLFEILSRAPAESRLETGETVIGGMVFAGGKFRDMSAAEKQQYSQRMQGLRSRGEDVELNKIIDDLPDDPLIKARVGELRLAGANRQQIYEAVAPMLRAYQPPKPKAAPGELDFTDSATDLVDQLMKSRYDKFSDTYSGDPAHIEKLEQIKSNILQSKTRAQMNINKKGAVDAARAEVSSYLSMVSSPENIDGYIFYEEADTKPGFKRRFKLDALKATNEDEYAMGRAVAFGLGKEMNADIEQAANDIRRRGSANGAFLTDDVLYAQARTQAYGMVEAKMKSSDIDAPSRFVRILRNAEFGYGEDQIRKFIETSFPDLTDTELKAIFSDTNR